MFASILLVVFMLVTGAALAVVNFHTAERLFMLMVTLQLCAFYQQRFYLDWRNEWGLHWRAKLLQLARWPYFIAALYEVILDRHFPYALTHKLKGNSIRSTALWPHLLVAILICGAWSISVIFQHSIHPLIHIWAAMIFLASLVILLTARWEYPVPYDRALSPSARQVNVPSST
jgi:hypothetical protein